MRSHFLPTGTTLQSWNFPTGSLGRGFTQTFGPPTGAVPGREGAFDDGGPRAGRLTGARRGLRGLLGFPGKFGLLSQDGLFGVLAGFFGLFTGFFELLGFAGLPELVGYFGLRGSFGHAGFWGELIGFRGLFGFFALSGLAGLAGEAGSRGVPISPFIGALGIGAL